MELGTILYLWVAEFQGLQNALCVSLVGLQLLLTVNKIYYIKDLITYLSKHKSDKSILR